MFCVVPLQTYLYRRDRLKHGTNRPEARFLTSLVGVWGFPVSLLWFAFTDDGYVLAPISSLRHDPCGLVHMGRRSFGPRLLGRADSQCH
jgi:hypothetical protein